MTSSETHLRHISLLDSSVRAHIPISALGVYVPILVSDPPECTCNPIVSRLPIHSHYVCAWIPVFIQVPEDVANMR
jgi:hypothetical protein